MKTIKLILVTILMIVLSASFVNGQNKLAQTGMKFLQVSTDARAAAMADAVTALEGNSASIFFNPASMARIKNKVDVTIGAVRWIADIQYYFASAAVPIDGGAYGVAGISWEAVDYGNFYRTIRSTNTLGYINLGVFRPSAFVFGISYANAISEKFSVGGNIRYAQQDLTNSVIKVNTDGSMNTRAYRPSAVIYDFGMLFHTGIKSLDLGVSIRNFSKELKLEQEGYQLPLMFQVGLAFNLSDVLNLDKKEHSIQLAVDANHPRDYNEQLMIGLEYKYMDMIALRIGNSSPNDEHHLTFGFGITSSNPDCNIGVDYCYTPWTTFMEVHKLSLHFSL